MSSTPTPHLRLVGADEARNGRHQGRDVATTTALGIRWVASRSRTGEIARSTAQAQRFTVLSFVAVSPADPRRITKRTIERWRSTISHLAPGTQRTRWSIIRCFLAWLLQEQIINRDPMSGMKPPRVPRPAHRALGRDQVCALLAVAEDPRDRLIVVLGHQLGLRRAEIAGIETGDLNLSRATVTVVGKGQKRRTVPLTVTARTELDHYLRWAGVTAGPLLRLPRYPERGLQPIWVGRRLSTLAYLAGIKHRPRDGVSTHALRHTCATEMHDGGAPIMVIRDVLGHESLATTEIYVRGLGVEAMREAMEGRDYLQAA